MLQLAAHSNAARSLNAAEKDLFLQNWSVDCPDDIDLFNSAIVDLFALAINVPDDGIDDLL